jgi:DNA-binding NarL/FixJ family response regulator/signal transduction histidine kinase
VNPLRRIDTWFRTHPILTDVLVACLLVFLFSMVSVGLVAPESGGSTQYRLFQVVTYVCAVGQLAPWAIRRWKPVLSAAIVVFFCLVQLLVGPDLLPSLIAVPMTVHNLAANGPRWASFAGLGTALAGSLFNGIKVGYFPAPSFDPSGQMVLSRPLTEPGELTGGALVVGVGTAVACTAIVLAAWAFGDLARTRRLALEQLRDRARQLEVEAAQERALAAADERNHIAREMHDIVAHSLQVIITQADGGRYAGAQDPAVAVGTLQTISDTGRRALGEMRRLLGVLRGPEAVELHPQPGLADVDGLVETIQLTGLEVEFTVEGTPRGPGGADQHGPPRRPERGGRGPAALDGPGTGDLRGRRRPGRRRVRGEPRLGPGPDGTARADRPVRRFGLGGPAPGRWLQRAGHRALPGDLNRAGPFPVPPHQEDPSPGEPRGRCPLLVVGMADDGMVTSDPAPIRVALVDDQQLVRSGLGMLINSQPDLDVVGEASTGREAVASPSVRGADVILMDVRMPQLDGIAATRALLGEVDDGGRAPGAEGAGSAAAPGTTGRRDGNGAVAGPRVVVLTTFDLDEYALEAIEAGASGFLLKDAPPEELLAAIRTVHRGDAVIAPSTTRRLLDHMAPTLRRDHAADRRRQQESAAVESLTPREREVLELMARGDSNQEIAAGLFLSEATVKTHVGRVLSKLRARDRVQAVVTAYRTGVAHP